VRSPRAEDWLAKGGHFSWRPADGAAAAVEVFHVELGDRDAPVLALVHGFPTCSIDWYEVAERLATRFRVCALDFPGYGFSDKPPAWGYSLKRDAELLDHYLAEVAGARSAVMAAHDRGDSVALVHAANAAEGRARVELEHLVLSNANIFLPLSNLTPWQRMMLDETTAAQVVANMTPDMLAQGMGATTFTPPRDADDPDVLALAATFAHNDGLAVMHETIQYLHERSADEQSWLDALAASSTQTTLIWGLNDTVAPPRVAMHVWDRHLMLKPGANAIYFIPDANHYLQNDRPDAFADAVRHALSGRDARPPGAIDSSPGSPILVDCSRERLPAASELLAPPPGVPG
jgi:pimeloyl-ACP methyl ester carboxylesterase